MREKSRDRFDIKAPGLCRDADTFGCRERKQMSTLGPDLAYNARVEAILNEGAPSLEQEAPPELPPAAETAHRADGEEHVPRTAVPATDAPRKRRGRKEYDVWPAMFGDHLISAVKERGRPFDTFDAAAWEGLQFHKAAGKRLVTKKARAPPNRPTKPFVKRSVKSDPIWFAVNCG